MILKRLTTGPCIRLGMLSRSMQTPSTRYRTRTRLAIGSMWMSEDRIRTASPMIIVTSRMMGADSSSKPSWLSASRSPGMSRSSRSWTWSSRLMSVWMNCST